MRIDFFVGRLIPGEMADVVTVSHSRLRSGQHWVEFELTLMRRRLIVSVLRR